MQSDVMLRQVKSPLRRIGIIHLVLGFTFLSPLPLWAQATDSLLAAGSEYEASSFSKLFFGSNWRTVWTTPIRIPFLSLSEQGLTPIKLGGGLQTKTLHLQSASGLRYKFRSVNKDPKRVLPPDLQESIAASVLQDQISASFPYAAMVTFPLMQALGIAAFPPRLVVMADDSLLLMYRELFKGVAGFLEINPKGTVEEGDVTADADKIEDTIDLLKRLETHHRDQVDAEDFLRARLFDVFVGDWDRHVGQWKFMRNPGKKGQFNRWIALPQDRDQAFARYVGLLPWLGTQLIPQIKSFSEAFPATHFATWSGRYLDRRFLAVLSKADWLRVTHTIQETLTDSLLRAAVGVLPKEIHHETTDFLFDALKHRRDTLESIAMEYYALLAEEPEFYGSAMSERLHIDVMNQDSLRVTLYSGLPSFAGMPIIAERVLYQKETSEVRFFLGKGTDEITITGPPSPIRLRLCFENDASPRLSLASSENIIVSFRGSRRDFFSTTPEVIEEPFKAPRFPIDSLNFRNPDRDFGSQWWYDLVFRYASEYGLILGYQPSYLTYGFERQPYHSRLLITGAYSPTSLRGIFSLHLDFPYLLSYTGRLGVEARAAASGLEVIRFYGIGNESVIDRQVSDRYYLARQTHYSIYTGMYAPFLNQRLKLFAGVEGRWVQTGDDDAEPKFIRENPVFGSSDLGYVKVSTGVHFDSRDRALFPSTGVLVQLQGDMLPAIFGLRDPVFRVSGDFRAYFSLWDRGDVFALRARGESVKGNAPFFELASVGGKRSIRGYDQQRFLGNQALLFSAEWRQSLINYVFLVPTTMGILGFSESGRVFTDNDASRLWHSGIGGGIWFSFVEPDQILSFSIGASREMIGYYAAIGFTF